MDAYRRLIIRALDLVTRIDDNDAMTPAIREWTEDARETLKTDPDYLDAEEYQRRALPRLEAIDRLAARIDFSTYAWRHTPDGERYSALMNEQAQDEWRAGL